MGHLPIVDKDSLELMIRKRAVLVKVPGEHCKPSQKWADILADALCVRKGDHVYPWMVKSKKAGFSYRFIASDSAFLVDEDEYHIGIPVESIYQQSSSHLSERSALELFPRSPGDGILWNAIGKKSLRRGRAITHQTLKEDRLMRELLRPMASCRPEKSPEELGSCTPSFVAKAGVRSSPNGKITALDLDSPKWSKDGHFRWEKALEASLISVLGTDQQQGFLDALGMPKAQVIWFANYLTYGVQGGSIDLLVLVRDAGVEKVLVVELKKGGLAPKPLRNAVAQVKAYARYVEKAFGAFGATIKTIPIVVSGNRRNIHRPDPRDGVRHVLYQVEKGSVVYREA
jgi:hypothetical protein